jgi:lipopolysaccharide/colanic/teichoic acid biosynthesis glycosyltransferase
MKRCFDFCISAIALLVLAPLFIIIMLLVRIFLGSPVFFYQTRPGLNGIPFRMYKFRSMLSNKDKNGNELADSLRLNTFGKLLRASSLDELPELINVLRGEMSLVGPRPLLTEYLPLYSVEQARRHDVLPGITGWAQVNGRNTLSWHDKFNYDVWYVDNRSFWLDIKILYMTVKKVIARDGINENGEATTSKFKGNS